VRAALAFAAAALAACARPGDGMTANKRTVEAYMDGFRATDRAKILSCLTDDVEWEIPGLFHVNGKAAFAEHIVDEGFTGKPDITISRMTEENGVVIAEGSVRAGRTDGTTMNLVFCDVFEMRDGKIRKLVSYLMDTKSGAPG
jgi:ketosteroid isomerase-like protein